MTSCFLLTSSFSLLPSHFFLLTSRVATPTAHRAGPGTADDGPEVGLDPNRSEELRRAMEATSRRVLGGQNLPSIEPVWEGRKQERRADWLASMTMPLRTRRLRQPDRHPNRGVECLALSFGAPAEPQSCRRYGTPRGQQQGKEAENPADGPHRQARGSGNQPPGKRETAHGGNQQRADATGSRRHAGNGRQREPTPQRAPTGP